MPRLGGRLIGLAVAGALAAPLAACGPADREPGKQAASSFADGAVAPTTTTAVTTTTTAPDRDALMAAVVQEAGREFVRQDLDVRVLGGRFDERADLVMLVIEVSSPTRALLTPIIDSSAPSHSLTDGTVIIPTEALAAGAGASKDLLGRVDGFAVEFIDSDGASAGTLAYASFDLQMYVDGKISLDELLSFAMVSGGAGQPATTTNVADERVTAPWQSSPSGSFPPAVQEVIDRWKARPGVPGCPLLAFERLPDSYELAYADYTGFGQFHVRWSMGGSYTSGLGLIVMPIDALSMYTSLGEPIDYADGSTMYAKFTGTEGVGHYIIVPADNSCAYAISAGAMVDISYLDSLRFVPGT